MNDYHLSLNWDKHNNRWLCWLQPDDEVFSGTNKKHKNRIIACFSSTGEDSLENCPSIVTGLERVEQYLAREEKRCNSEKICQEKARTDFERVFQNATMITAWKKEQDSKYYFRVFVRIEPDGMQLEVKWAKVTLFKAIYLYLLREDRYRTFDADIVFVYCAWQRYNLAKELAKQSAVKNDQNSAQNKPISQLDYEFALAYRALAELLEHDTFSYAFYVLWRYRSGTGHNLSNPLIRERLRTSMVLSEKKVPDQISPAPPEMPIEAPLCLRSRPDWRNVDIHPWFAEKRSKTTVRRLIRNWLLPRYGLWSTIRLAAKLKPERWWLKLAKVGVGIFVILLVIWLYSTKGSLSESRAGAVILQGLAPVVLAMALFYLDKSSISHLILPRLCGGIFIGYFPLIITQEAWLLSTLFTSPSRMDAPYAPEWRMIILLWAFIIAFALFYFANEAFVYTNDWWEAFRRASVVLIWAIIVTISIGAWESQFGIPILESIDICPRAEGFQPLKFIWMLPGVIKMIPVPVLMTFAPLALLIGIMMQIIWEDKPITATVWSPEEQ